MADCACGPAAHPPTIFAQVFILLTLQHIAQRGKRTCGPDSHLLHKAQEVGHAKTKGRRLKTPRNSLETRDKSGQAGFTKTGKLRRDPSLRFDFIRRRKMGTFAGRRDADPGRIGVFRKLILVGFKSYKNGSADSAGVAGAFCGCADFARLSAKSALVAEI